MITVDITFGGLCLLVQKVDKDVGMWVLMPDVSHHADMRHCAMLIVEEDPNFGNERVLYSLAKKDIDFTSFGTNAAPVARPEFMFEVSKYASGAPVAERYFKHHMEADLISRVHLPLGTELESVVMSPGKQLGEVFVGGTGRVQTIGMVHARANIPDGTIVKIPVAGAAYPTVDLTANPGGTIAFTIANAPRGHIDLPNRIKHRAGEPITHTAHYYPLLDVECGVDERCQAAYSFGDVDGIPEPRYAACPTSPKPIPLVVWFIEPINCSVGYGCPNQDAC